MPVIIFFKSFLFKRSSALKVAASEFERNVGYLATIIVIIAGLAVSLVAIRSITVK